MRLGASIDFHNLVIVSLAAIRMLATIILYCGGKKSRLIFSRAIAGLSLSRLLLREVINDDTEFQKLDRFLQLHNI